MKAQPVDISFFPIDNQRLANLCGVLDENLKQIETTLDVTIARRGEHFNLHGRSTQTKLAAKALRNFYNQSQHHLTIEQIQLGLIEVMSYKRAPKYTSTDPLANDTAPPILSIRRNDLHGRTPRQVQYLKQIQQHDITFAIGPAGTGKTYLAVASAVDALERDTVARIVLVRPAVEAGERLGFLPRRYGAEGRPLLTSSLRCTL